MGRRWGKLGRAPSEKKIIVVCKYCGKEYYAASKRSIYGCPNYSCNVKADLEKSERERNHQKKFKAKRRNK